jgi:plastocyanin
VNPFSSPRPRIGLIAVAAVLVAACSGSGAPRLTFPPAGAAGAAASATATASASTAATRDASPTDDSPSPTASASSPDDSPSPTATSTTPAATPPAPAAVDPRSDGLDISFGEYAITLEASVIRPGPVTLVVHNAGQLVHGLEMQLDVSGKGGADRHKIETRTFRSGETLRVEADLPAGTYEVECYMPGHAALGMRTTLQVRANAPLATQNPTVPAGAVRIVQFAFVAASTDIAVGTTVSWTNEDPTPHTVTADGGTFDSRQLDPGAGFSTVFKTPGSFAYHCEIHPTMVGTVVVR